MIITFFSANSTFIHIGRVCHDSYHWRCVKPETISLYVKNDRYICDNCKDGTTSNLSYQMPHNDIMMQSTDLITADYRGVASLPTKTNSMNTNVGNTTRYFEDKQQESKMRTTLQPFELVDDISAQVNTREYYQYNGKI